MPSASMPRDEHRELVAAEPRGQVAGAARGAQAVGDEDAARGRRPGGRSAVLTRLKSSTSSISSPMHWPRRGTAIASISARRFASPVSGSVRASSSARARSAIIPRLPVISRNASSQ